MDAHGPAEVGEFFQLLASMWDGLGVDIEHMLPSGDRVVVLATTYGRFGDIDTSYRSAHVWALQEGKAVRFDEYVDQPKELLDAAHRPGASTQAADGPAGPLSCAPCGCSSVG